MPELKPGYRGTVNPVDYLSSGDQERALRSSTIGQDYFTLAGAAVENQWLTNAAGRLYERNEEYAADPNFVVQQEQLAPFELEFNHEDREYLTESVSQEEFNRRVGFIRSDKERHQLISQYGVRGAAAEILAGVFDPVGWGIGIMTGFAGVGAKGTQLARAGRTALAVGTEAAALEAALVASDTQRDAEDIIFATGAGLLLGGTLGLAFRRSPQGGDIAKTADDFDAALKAETEQVLRKSEVEEVNDIAPVELPEEYVTETGTRTRIDSGAITRTIEDHISALEQLSRRRNVFTRQQRADSTRQLADYDSQITELRDLWNTHRSRVAAFFGAPRNAAEDLRNQYRFQGIRNIYEPRINALQERADNLRERLSGNDAAERAGRELDEFRQLDKVSQVRRLFPEGLPRMDVEIERQVQAVRDSVPRREPDDPEPPQDSGSGDSVGAARVEGDTDGQVEDLFVNGETLDEFVTDLVQGMAERPQPVTTRLFGQTISDRVQSAFTTIDNSENLAFRALAHKLLENPQGGVVPEDTASILSFVYDKQIRASIRNRYNEGFEEWSVAEGRNLVTAQIDKGRWRDDFDRQVYLKITNPSLEVHPAIAKSADGLRDGFAKALEVRKDAGEGGFDFIESDGRYVPRVFDGHRMNKAAADFSRDHVIRVLSRGYQTGGRKLGKESADRLAEMQYVRTMNTTLSGRQSFNQVVSQAERERFLQELRDAGIEEEVIEQFIEGKEAAELLDSVSNRAKAGLYINPEAEVDGLRVIDLLNYNLSELSESYIREAAGGAAMARKGFKTQQQAIQVIEAAEAYGRNLNMSPARLREESNILKDSVTMLYGQSIERDPRGSLEVGTRRLREYTALIRLGQVGFASFSEAARLISELGLKNVLSAVPGTAIFRRRSAREGGLTSGQLREPELREIEEVLGYVGEDNWLRPINVRHEDFGEGSATNDLGRLYDNAVALGARVNTVASGFQAIQGGLEKIAMRSLKRRVIDMAEGRVPWETGLPEEVGWTEAFRDELSEWIRNNPKTERFGGNDVRLMNLAEMPPELREKVLVGLTRMSGRLIQKNFVGETSVWMNKWLGKTLTQFRTFSVVSAEKQLIHDLKGDKIRAAQILGWSTLLGYISYATQVHLQALGESDPERFLDERFTDRAVAFGVFNKLPQTASLSLGGDFIATLGLLPDDMYSAPGRFGFRPLTAGTIAPAAGTIADTVGLVNATVDAITGETTAPEVADKVRKLIPLGNAIGTGQILKAGIEQLD